MEQIPPGIISVKSKTGTIEDMSDSFGVSYEDYYSFRIKNGSQIHTIEQDGKRYSVGDKAEWNYSGSKIEITGFQYSDNQWFVHWSKNTAPIKGTTYLTDVTLLPQPSPEDKPASDPKEESKWVKALKTEAWYKEGDIIEVNPHKVGFYFYNANESSQCIREEVCIEVPKPMETSKLIRSIVEEYFGNVKGEYGFKKDSAAHKYIETINPPTTQSEGRTPSPPTIQ